MRTRGDTIGRAVAAAVFAAIIAGAAIHVVAGGRAETITAAQGGVVITGRYGATILYADIRAVEVADHIPRIRTRLHGYGLAGNNKGYFRLEEWGRTLLFTHRKSKGPYIVITDSGGKKTAFKTSDPGEARVLSIAVKERIAPAAGS